MVIRSIQSIVFLSLCVGCVLLSVLKPIAVAETTTQTFANADRYVGEMQNGQFHGQGAYFFSNGNEYEGAFHQGKYRRVSFSLSRLDNFVTGIALQLSIAVLNES